MKLQVQAPKQRSRDRFLDFEVWISLELGVWDFGVSFSSPSIDHLAAITPSSAAFNSRCRSRSWFAVTGVGASVISRRPLAVFGKAITSRMLGVPQRIAQDVETQRDAAVGWGTVLERFQQVADRNLVSSRYLEHLLDITVF